MSGRKESKFNGMNMFLPKMVLQPSWFWRYKERVGNHEMRIDIDITPSLGEGP